MSTFKLASLGLVGIAVVGAVVLLFQPRLGGALLGLAVAGLVFLCLGQMRQMVALQGTMHRNVKEYHRLQKDALARLEQKVGRLEGAATTSASAPAPARENRPKPPVALAGRAAAPDVTNATTELTLARALDPVAARSRRVVLGALSQSLQARLEAEGFTVQALRRGQVVEQVKDTEAANLVIDEDAFNSGDWFSALDATGASRAKELVEGLRAAQGRGMQCFVLPGSRAVPHVNSSALRPKGVVVLPLAEDQLAEAHGAPLSGGLLPTLQEVAAARVEVVSR